MTHAFFKALLFLGAGSVIHGTHEQDIRQLGGLFGKMKQTGTTFVIASLAIAGIPPLSGFWSKDEILLEAFATGNYLVYFVLLLTAFMTSFYMFRLVFLTFFGKPRNPEIHAHESPAVMTLPLMGLAIGAIGVGIPGSPLMNHWFQGFILGAEHHGEVASNWFVMGSSIAAGFGGIILAALIYLQNPNWATAITTRFKPLYQISVNKFWMDEIYSVLIVNPFQALGDLLSRFDRSVIDGLVNGTASATLKTSDSQMWVDKYLVDGAVNLTALVVLFFGTILKFVQTGSTQFYLSVTLLGLLVFVFLEVSQYDGVFDMLINHLP